MLVHDVSRWIDAADKDDERLREMLERLRYAETHEEPPEITDWGEKGTPSEVRLVPLSLDEVAGARRELESILEIKAQYRQMVAEMALVNLVAAFEAFLGDLLKYVLTCRPELLKGSGKSLTFAEIVDSHSRENLIEELAEREVRGWQYKSFRDQVEILRGRFAAELKGPNDDTDPESVIETFAHRNLLVHNRGVVNATYLALVPTSEAKVGDRLVTTPEYWDRAAEELLTVASHLAPFMSARHLKPAGGSTDLAPRSDG
jgi:hypothetical protein